MTIEHACANCASGQPCKSGCKGIDRRTCPGCVAGALRRIQTRNGHNPTIIKLRLFLCDTCGKTFISGESWLGEFGGKRYIPVPEGA